MQLLQSLNKCKTTTTKMPQQTTTENVTTADKKYPHWCVRDDTTQQPQATTAQTKCAASIFTPG